MKLLFISDKFDFEAHSFMDGVINKYLKNSIDVDVVYWSKKGSFLKKDDKFLVPYKQNLHRYINLEDYNFIIVRNFFNILKQILSYKSRYRYKVGFQLSFPHTYRRIHQAKVEKRAVIRKTIEYKIKTFYEKRLINQCDYFFPISKYMINLFYDDIKTPYFVLPLGVDEDYIVEKKFTDHQEIKMVYIGTIDKLRGFDNVLNHLANYANKNWRLDIYSKTVPAIPDIVKDKVDIKGYIERKKLIQKISDYDLGLFLLPENRLYDVASPTKVMEYYQAGIPAIMSSINECKELFYPDKGFIMDFNNLNFDIVFNSSLEKLNIMGSGGQKTLLEKRNYKHIAKNLYEFIIN